MGCAIHGFGSESVIRFVGSAFAFSNLSLPEWVSGGEVVTRNVPQMVLVELELRIKCLEAA